LANIPTLFIGQNLLSFEALDSTNDYAHSLLAKTKPIEGTVISAGYQHQGRGQIGSSWYSSPQANLLFSVILYPRFISGQQQFLLSQATALALVDALAPQLGAGLRIKWPNDLYYGDQKLAGILIQNALQGKTILNTVIGIGLNVNEQSFPAALPNPISLQQITGQPWLREPLLGQLLQQLEQRYLQLKNGKFEEIRAAYQQLLYQQGKPCRYQRADGSIFEGTILGVTDIGKLQIAHETGTEVFAPKEVVFLRG